eukprot:210432-Rhodomonas_salina.2
MTTDQQPQVSCPFSSWLPCPSSPSPAPATHPSSAPPRASASTSGGEKSAWTQTLDSTQGGLCQVAVERDTLAEPCGL